MFTLVPKSSKTFIMWVSPVSYKIIRDLGFLYFIGTWLDKYELTLTVKNTLLDTLVVLFLVQKSFKNLA